jgi:hypothetical protein
MKKRKLEAELLLTISSSSSSNALWKSLMVSGSFDCEVPGTCVRFP